MSNRDKVGRPFLCRSGINSDFMPFMGGQREIGIKFKKKCVPWKNRQKIYSVQNKWHKIGSTTVLAFCTLPISRDRLLPPPMGPQRASRKRGLSLLEPFSPSGACRHPCEALYYVFLFLFFVFVFVFVLILRRMGKNKA